MARRKSKAKQQEEFIQSLLGLIVLGSIFGTFYFTDSLTASVIVCLLSVSVYIGVMIRIGVKKAERLKRSGIADIDNMDGVQFEKYLGYLFQAHGYKTEVTKTIGDYGADLILQKEGKKIVVQAKRYSKNVGIKAVQEAQASIAYYAASEAWVISNSDYTAAAYDLAKSNKVRLIHREELIEMILALNPGTAPVASEVIEDHPTREIPCPRCGANLVLRSGSRGQFYGCRSFPKCRHTQQVEFT
ncbi:hypothetical protein BVG16_01170 [Paenibacillus selenitireducens]|uniref:Restriction endonuclease n=1 Tax=Paenibacillus selenitireducens TaxID=1324314 RepID=A0A1T2XM91_9BACL|nr:restriction endonuclease [Paenibacillus selenitireducens]OPA80989.1 hypothetical protein BVG16_01170 [Paenibacillus selenitireducens]